MCVSFDLGWILSRANLKDVFVHFEDLKYHGLIDVLRCDIICMTFEQCYENKIFELHRYINVY